MSTKSTLTLSQRQHLTTPHSKQHHRLKNNTCNATNACRNFIRNWRKRTKRTDAAFRNLLTTTRNITINSSIRRNKCTNRAICSPKLINRRRELSWRLLGHRRFVGDLRGDWGTWRRINMLRNLAPSTDPLRKSRTHLHQRNQVWIAFVWNVHKSW